MNDNWGLSDEELDGLFRQAADGQRPRFDPEDWRDMAARLDASGKATPTRDKPWWRWWPLALLLLLFTGAGLTWWALTPGSATRSGAPAQGRVSGTTPGAAATGEPTARVVGKAGSGRREAESLADPETSGVDGAPSTGRANEETTPRATQPEGIGSAKTAAGSAAVKDGFSEKRIARVPATPNRTVRTARNTEPGQGAAGAGVSSERPPLAAVGTARSGDRAASWKSTRHGLTRRATASVSRGWVAASGTRRSVGLNQKPAGIKPAPVNAEVTGSTPVAGPPAETPAVADDRATWAVSSLSPRRVLPKPGPVLEWPTELVLPEDTPERRDRVTRPPTPRGRFGIRGVLSPDLNSVSTFKPSAFGNSYGLLLEYEVLPRWRVQTGFIRSQKDYSASTAEYTFQYGYWAHLGHPRPDEVDAKCALFDIPINLRYDLWRRPRFDVFVNAGVSTYLMHNEKYVYRYANKPTYIVRDSVRNGGGHFANTFNLSVGYQRQLGDGFSLQVEPYLKLPLAAVGFGSVRLYSLGLHLSLAFHPLRRRSPVGR